MIDDHQQKMIKMFFIWTKLISDSV